MQEARRPGPRCKVLHKPITKRLSCPKELGQLQGGAGIWIGHETGSVKWAWAVRASSAQPGFEVEEGHGAMKPGIFRVQVQAALSSLSLLKKSPKKILHDD